MEVPPSKNNENFTTASVIREFLSSLKELLRSEIHLAKVEAKETSHQLARHATEAVFFGILALSGILPMLAFFIIGLGKILNDNYWLSSLIIAIFCLIVGGFLGFRAFKKLLQQDLTLPHTRENIEQELEMVDKKFQQIYDGAKRSLT